VSSSGIAATSTIPSAAAPRADDRKTRFQEGFLQLEDREENGEHDAADDDTHHDDEDRFDERRQRLDLGLHLLVVELAHLPE
jgi:hypothetical protein